MNRLVIALFAAASLSAPTGRSDSTVFVGSTPCAEPVRALLEIPRAANAELIEWELTLNEAAGSAAGATYHLRYRFGRTRPNQPGLDADAPQLERRGTWRADAGTRGSASPIVKLDGSVSLMRVGETILHLLAPDGSLMVGNGGWSYSLSRRDAVEKDVDAHVVAADPGDPSRTTSRETGPSVFGVFDGRTPCQGIARELGVAARPGCAKAKWRLTLFQDPNTHQPTTYRLEGSLYGSHPREGSWRIARGTTILPAAEVYELAAVNGEAAASLLKADDRVLFFLDRNRRPLTGNARNAYTLDRRSFNPDGAEASGGQFGKR
jgi:hypothetical protein